MDNFEKIGYAILAVVAACWLAAVLYGVIAALPYGLVGLAAITGIGVLFIKVIRDRLANKEDDYYSKNVDR
ncbi:MAG: hypothetical protein HKN81_11640 [Gammaproteobacteria bacterium]|nr:hypothetical protein [Gammaproteobacteria bacterium]NND37774.1 hypothetical protein [Gammaproteobacteria bacterium]